MKNYILLILTTLFIKVNSVAFAQGAEQLEVNIETQNNGKWRNLVPVVKNGSGEYTYVWLCSAKYGIAVERSAKVAVVPLDQEDITYDVFVRDQKTGSVGHRSINFSQKFKTAGVVTYPNPSREEVIVSLEDYQGQSINEKQKITRAELYSEATKSLVRSSPITGNSVKEIKFNVKNLSPGTYYVHLWINDDVHSEPQRKEVRVLVGGQ